MNIGIIGLGLMGGSLAKAVKRYGISKKVYGFTNSEKKKEIEELGLVDELVDLETLKKFQTLLFYLFLLMLLFLCFLIFWI